MPTQPPPPKLEDDIASIVLLGSFNPAIFQPAWFAAKGLIREAEATAATIEMIHPEVTAFRVGWLTLNVTRERFVSMSSDAAQHVALRDLVLGTFQLLEHTPTSRLGMNRSMHFLLHDEGKWHRLGHLLAPKQPWADLTVDPGLLSLRMQSKRNDGLNGRAIFHVEPSSKYRFGAFIEVNNEFVAKRDFTQLIQPFYPPISPSPATSDVTPEFLELIRVHWDRLLQLASEQAQRLLERIPEEANV
jgi:hypothetical protein